MRRLATGRWYDAVLGAGFAMAGVLDHLLADQAQGPLSLNLLCAVVVGALVGIRRRHPIVAAAVYVVTLALQGAFLTLPTDLTIAFVGLLLFPYAAGAYAAPAWSVLTGPAMCAMVGFVEAVDGTLRAWDLAFTAIIATAAWSAGRNVRSRNRLAAELHEAAVRAEEEREADAERAVAAERRRIAREMHDIVAHSMSVMVVQAGGARRIMDRDPRRAVEAAGRIERTGREALGEMRRLLGVLQTGEHEAARAPQPGLGAVQQLVARAREAGLPAQLDEEGTPRPLPAGLDVAAYRIVQEALTNAVKYAAGAPTEVRVHWGRDALELCVADRGPGTAVAAGAPGADGLVGGGHGIIGMRERVRLYGGEIHTGQRSGGGFEVRARLPLQAEEVTTA